jgi:hypothetical protein
MTKYKEELKLYKLSNGNYLKSKEHSQYITQYGNLDEIGWLCGIFTLSKLVTPTISRVRSFSSKGNSWSSKNIEYVATSPKRSKNKSNTI